MLGKHLLLSTTAAAAAVGANLRAICGDRLIAASARQGRSPPYIVTRAASSGNATTTLADASPPPTAETPQRIRPHELPLKRVPHAKYGGRYMCTMLPGDGIGPEMMEHIRRIFTFAHVNFLTQKRALLFEIRKIPTAYSGEKRK